MNAHTKLILLTLFCVFLEVSLGQDAKCEECMADNEAYCVDKNTYYLCVGGKPMKSELHTCPKDQVCSKSSDICVEESETNKPVCGDSSCNNCPPDGSKYTCVSKTQFGRCVGNKVTVVSSCETGSICSTDMFKNYEKICAPTCVLDFFGLSATCTNDKPITTTVAPPTTPNVDSLKQKCKDKEDPNKNIYYILADDTCKTYIYCEKVGSGFEAILMKCPNNTFYDVEKKECVSVKPSTCT